MVASGHVAGSRRRSGGMAPRRPLRAEVDLLMATLVTGITGGLAQRVAERLVAEGDGVVGVDYRDVHDVANALPGVAVHRASYNKTAIEDVFRKHGVSTVLHLGRVGNLSENI